MNFFLLLFLVLLGINTTTVFGRDFQLYKQINETLLAEDFIFSYSEFLKDHHLVARSGEGLTFLDIGGRILKKWPDDPCENISILDSRYVMTHSEEVTNELCKKGVCQQSYLRIYDRWGNRIQSIETGVGPNRHYSASKGALNKFNQLLFHSRFRNGNSNAYFDKTILYLWDLNAKKIKKVANLSPSFRPLVLDNGDFLVGSANSLYVVTRKGRISKVFTIPEDESEKHVWILGLTKTSKGKISLSTQRGFYVFNSDFTVETKYIRPSQVYHLQSEIFECSDGNYILPTPEKKYLFINVHGEVFATLPQSDWQLSPVKVNNNRVVLNNGKGLTLTTCEGEVLKTTSDFPALGTPSTNRAGELFYFSPEGVSKGHLVAMDANLNIIATRYYYDFPVNFVYLEESKLLTVNLYDSRSIQFLELK